MIAGPIANPTIPKDARANVNAISVSTRRNFALPFHPPRLKDIPNDQFKNDNANNEHEEALNRLPLNH